MNQSGLLYGGSFARDQSLELPVNSQYPASYNSTNAQAGHISPGLPLSATTQSGGPSGTALQRSKTGQTFADVAASFREPLAQNSAALSQNQQPRDQAKFEQLFKAAVGDEQVMSGDQARDLLLRSKLSGDDLSKVWMLSDTTKSGQLLFPEFALAMYLCNMRITGKALPVSLPERVRNEVSGMVDIISFGVPETTTISSPTAPDLSVSSRSFQTAPQVTASAGAPNHGLPMYTSSTGPYGHANLQSDRPPANHLTTPSPYRQTSGTNAFTMHQTGQFQGQSQSGSTNVMFPMPMQQTGAPGLLSAPLGTATSNLSDVQSLQRRLMPQAYAGDGNSAGFGFERGVDVPWAISKDEKRLYDDLFRAWDSLNRGVITGAVAISIMGQSGLANETLEAIWNLSDPSNKGYLDMDEFAVSMHLIYRCLNGHSVPSRLPNELIPPSVRNLSLSIGAVKSLLSKDAETLREGRDYLKPQGTGVSYLKSHSFGDNQRNSSSRKDATVFKNDDTDVGYRSTARRRTKTGMTSSDATDTKDLNEDQPTRSREMDLDGLKKIVRERKAIIDALDIRSEREEEQDASLDRKDRLEAEQLFGRIHRLQEEILNHPSSTGLTITTDNERRVAVRRLEMNLDKLTKLAADARRVEDDIQACKITEAKLRSESVNGLGTVNIVGTGPGGSVTESDRLKARARALMEQRSAALTGRSAPPQANEQELQQKFESARRLANDELEKNQRLIKEAEGSIRDFADGLRSAIAVQQSPDNRGFESRRWEDAVGVTDEVKDFILELRRVKQRSISAKSQPVKSERPQVIDIAKSDGSRSSALDMRPDTAVATSTQAAAISTKLTDRSLYIKAEAERRMAERLAALGLKVPARTAPGNQIPAQVPTQKARDRDFEAEETRRDSERKARLQLENGADSVQPRQDKRPPPPPTRKAKLLDSFPKADLVDKAHSAADSPNKTPETPRRSPNLESRVETAESASLDSQAGFASAESNGPASDGIDDLSRPAVSVDHPDIRFPVVDLIPLEKAETAKGRGSTLESDTVQTRPVDRTSISQSAGTINGGSQSPTVESNNPFFNRRGRGPSQNGEKAQSSKVNPFQKPAATHFSAPIIDSIPPVGGFEHAPSAARSRGSIDDWSVDGSMDDSSDEDDGPVGNAAHLASMLFSTMNPKPASGQGSSPVQSTAMYSSKGNVTEAHGAPEPEISIPKTFTGDTGLQTPLSQSTPPLSLPSVPPPGPPPLPPTAPMSDRISNNSVVPLAPSIPAPSAVPPPPPPFLPGSNPALALVPSSGLGRGAPVGLLGEIQAGKGLRKVSTKDRSQASVAGRVLD